jgi:transposase
MRKPASIEDLERVRMFAANMFERGMKPKDIAAILEVDDQSVRRWRRQFQAGGRDALRGRKAPGATPRLDDAQRRQLLNMLTQEPATQGFEAHLWTTKLIAQLIERTFGVRYHHDYVGTLLHDLGLSWQKPMRRARERDEQAVQQWRTREWPELFKKA